MRRAGMTVMELLIVIAVAGVLLTIGSVLVTRLQRALEFRAVVTTLNADLSSARARARLGTTTWRVRSNGSSAYEVGRWNGAWQDRRVVNLPSGVKFTKEADVSFDAPHGLARATGTRGTWFALSGPDGRTADVKVVGLGGKVVTRAD